MHPLLTLSYLGALLPALAAATASSLLPISLPAQSYALCQKKTTNPLTGCPPHTIYVSQLPHPSAKFATIQAAISSLPADDITTRYTILIAPGEYKEQLNVTRSGPLTLLGVSDRPFYSQTLLPRYYPEFDYDKPLPSNEVHVRFDRANVGNNLLPDNVFTGVLTVGPTLNATFTGTGPQGWPVDPATPYGSADFRAYNIDFRNEFAQWGVGPAHAMGVSRANAGFYSCGFYSWQDTVSLFLSFFFFVRPRAWVTCSL